MRHRPLVLLFLLAGCAGGKAVIRADDIAYPVSLSKAVFDGSGQPFQPPQSAVVGHFSFSVTQWTLLFTLLPLSDVERDISAQLVQEIESRNGNAIVNLTVEGRGDYFWYLTSLIPILPTSCGVTIEGDVVRLDG